jgi:hypothetical protein
VAQLAVTQAICHVGVGVGTSVGLGEEVGGGDVGGGDVGGGEVGGGDVGGGDVGEGEVGEGDGVGAGDGDGAGAGADDGEGRPVTGVGVKRDSPGSGWKTGWPAGCLPGADRPC